jgi:Ca2+-binding RTX toxin-like protein
MVGDVAVGTSFECNTGMNISAYGDEGYNGNEIDLTLRNAAIGSEHRAYAEGNSFTAFNDLLVAGTGNNVVVGDVYALMQINDYGKGNEDVNRVELGASVLASQSAHASGNSFDAFNDTLTAGDSGAYGGNLMAGDVYASMSVNGGDCTQNEVNLYLKDVENTQTNNHDVASNNDFTAFNDSMTSGDGQDQMAGDVALVGQSNNTDSVNFTVFNDGDNNSFVAFNDTLSGGGGNDSMVGDVYMSGADSSQININITNNGSSSTFDLFNDQLTGGAGNDQLYGDFAGDNLNVTVNVSGDTSGMKLFEDTLDGGAGDDSLTGGLGSDLLTGGAGNDVFDFNSLDEAGDTVTSGDFTSGSDKVDIADVLGEIGNGNTEGQDWQITSLGGGDSAVQVSTDNGSSWTTLVTVLDATILSTDIVT